MNETTQKKSLDTLVSQSKTTGDVVETIPLTHLNNGMFFLHLTTYKGTTQVIPFTVQH
jgi:hypothetical protein